MIRSMFYCNILSKLNRLPTIIAFGSLQTRNFDESNIVCVAHHRALFFSPTDTLA